MNLPNDFREAVGDDPSKYQTYYRFIDGVSEDEILAAIPDFQILRVSGSQIIGYCPNRTPSTEELKNAGPRSRFPVRIKDGTHVPVLDTSKEEVVCTLIFAGPTPETEEWERIFKLEGITYIEAVGINECIVSFDPKNAERIANLKCVSEIKPYKPNVSLVPEEEYALPIYDLCFLNPSYARKAREKILARNITIAEEVNDSRFIVSIGFDDPNLSETIEFLTSFPGLKYFLQDCPPELCSASVLEGELGGASSLSF